MTFSEREKAFGNQIFFSSNRLQYASISDKINYVVQMGDRGRTSINEDREVFNLPPIENGDRHFIRGEYRPVDSYEEPVEPVEPPISGNKPVDKSADGDIIEERGWVTINGKHVFIGEDGGGSGDGSNSGNKNEFKDSSLDDKAITNEAIENVPKLNVFDDEAKNARYQQANKNLLKEAQKHPVGTEVSRVYDANMNPIENHGYIIGKKAGEVKIDNPEQLYHAFHNHPTNNTLSVDDLINLTKHDSMLSITAVGNGGKVYCMQKKDVSKGLAYRIFLQQQAKQKIFLGKYSYFDIKSGKIGQSILSEDDTKTVIQQLSAFSDKCVKAGAFYGFDYRQK